MPAVTFSVRCDETHWGESVGVLGSWIAWDKSQLVILSTSPDHFPLWSATISLNDQLVGHPLDYKYVITKDGHIARWEYHSSQNRELVVSSDITTSDIFGQPPSSTQRQGGNKQAPEQIPNQASREWNAENSTSHHFPDFDMDKLCPLERALVLYSQQKFSWRLRLSYIRSLFTEKEVAQEADFNPMSINSLATISIYLSFLSTGQLPCHEDGGHHRPNHHAHEARRIEAALSQVIQMVLGSDTVERGDVLTIPSESVRNRAYIPYVVRKIFPLLPSYSSQFTVSVPLTRIRDIAHRNDIPHDLKLDIKHNLQNKLHRSAGPEDLHTSARILKKISQGDFSQPFVDQFRIFHTELLAFFNAASLDDRLRYLQGCEHTRDVAASSGTLLGLKTQHANSLLQLRAQVKIRSGLNKLPLMQLPPSLSNDDENLPHEDVQKVRLADIQLEGYAFVLLAAEAKEAEDVTDPTSFPWQRLLESLSIAMNNMQLSAIRPEESTAIASELLATSELSFNKGRCLTAVLRTKAAVERALRFIHEFSDAIMDVYNQRAHTFGEALGVARHAIDVFAEAEVRSSLTFQASRLASACMTVTRRALNLPPWDALYAGKTFGVVLYVDKLGDALAKGSKEDSIIVCRLADGDEDIPTHVRGVVVGRKLPHLSHLGVRARQARVVFVCAEERSVFDEIWKRRLSGLCELQITAREGLAVWQEAFSAVSSSDHLAGNSGDEKIEIKSEEEEAAAISGLHFDTDFSEVLPLVKATRDLASSKCMFAGKLLDIANDSDGLFKAPGGVVIPHGVFQREREIHTKEYSNLVTAYNSLVARGGDSNEQENAVRELSDFIEANFRPGDSIISAIQNNFVDDARVMVRSSANAEDLEQMSGAGLYDSIANVAVKNSAELEKAITKVWGSVWTKRAASSRIAHAVKHEQVSMAVLVQEMVESDFSFVAFSREPVGNGSEVYIEVAVGMGETLASSSGEGSPYRVRIDREGLSVEEVSFASYSDALVPDKSEAHSGLRRTVVDYSTVWMTTADDRRTEVLKRIAMSVLMLEEAFDGPQDVEGAITVNDDDETSVYVVQARPQII